jgi:hypothetical protein
MKKYYIITSVLLAFVLLTAFSIPGGKSVKSVMKEYRHEKGFMLISVPACIVRPFIPAEEQIAKDIMKDVKMFRVLVGNEEADKGVFGELAYDVGSLLTSEYYHDFLEVITPEEKVMIKGREKNGVLTELVIFVNSPEESVIVQVTGKFLLKDLAKSARLVADL